MSVLEASHLSKAAFADDFEVVKVVGFDPNREEMIGSHDNHL